MKTSPTSFALLALMTTLSGTALAVTDVQNPDINKKIIADFEHKLFIIPCVEVTGSTFDGYYNVLLEISGNGSGSDWVLKQVTQATEDECEDDPNDQTSPDDLLKSMGMPSINDLIKNATKK